MGRKSYYGKYFDVKEFFDEFMPKEGIEQIETKHIAKYLGYKTSDPIQRLLCEFRLSSYYKRYKWDKEKVEIFSEEYNRNKYKEPKLEKIDFLTIKDVIEKMYREKNIELDKKSEKLLHRRIIYYLTGLYWQQEKIKKEIAKEKRTNPKYEPEIEQTDIGIKYHGYKEYWSIDKVAEQKIIKEFKWDGSQFFRPITITSKNAMFKSFYKGRELIDN